jgi:4-diphosphocytidyl-2-C-methyl-D-erythritol kinase
VGLLPNDFTPVLLKRYPEYETFFRAAELTGSTGYGITGSGSACFALFDEPHRMKDICSSCRTWKWVHKILALE